MAFPLPFGSAFLHVALSSAFFSPHLSLLQHMYIVCLPSDEPRRGSPVAKLLFKTARYVTEHCVASRQYYSQGGHFSQIGLVGHSSGKGVISCPCPSVWHDLYHIRTHHHAERRAHRHRPGVLTHQSQARRRFEVHGVLLSGQYPTREDIRSPHKLRHELCARSLKNV